MSQAQKTGLPATGSTVEINSEVTYSLRLIGDDRFLFRPGRIRPGGRGIGSCLQIELVRFTVHNGTPSDCCAIYGRLLFLDGTLGADLVGVTDVVVADHSALVDLFTRHDIPFRRTT
jgi:hypothetical protein